MNECLQIKSNTWTWDVQIAVFREIRTELGEIRPKNQCQGIRAHKKCENTEHCTEIFTFFLSEERCDPFDQNNSNNLTSIYVFDIMNSSFMLRTLLYVGLLK